MVKKDNGFIRNLNIGRIQKIFKDLIIKTYFFAKLKQRVKEYRYRTVHLTLNINMSYYQQGPPQQQQGYYQQGPPPQQQGYYQQQPQVIYVQQPPQQHHDDGCCSSCCKALCCFCCLELCCAEMCAPDPMMN